jgi:hypothetical protein
VASPPDTPAALSSSPRLIAHRSLFDYLRGSDAAQASLVEQYVGLPFEA